MSREFDSNLLYLVKQKSFYPHGYVSGFEKFKKNCQPNKKKKIIVRWWIKESVINVMNRFLKFGMHLKWKRW